MADSEKRLPESRSQDSGARLPNVGGQARSQQNQAEEELERGQSILLDELPAPTVRGGKNFYQLPVLFAGKWERFAVTPQQLAEMESNFKSRRNGEINVDYEHASEMPEVAAGGPVPSAGRVFNLAAGERLMASFEFTRRAEQMIREGEYRFLSPAFTYALKDKKTGENRGAALLSVALTNKPYLEELPAIKLSDVPGFGIRDSGLGSENRNSKTETPKPKENIMEKLVARTGQNGQLEILKGSEVVGFIELEQQVDEKPILAAFSERVGAKGKTEAEIKALVEGAGKFLAREATEAAHALLASECVKEGKLDREKMKIQARGQKVGMEDFLAFEDAFASVDAAVTAGKILPMNREFFLKVALSDVDGFKKFAEKAPKVIDLTVKGVGGEGAAGGTKANAAKGIEVDEQSVKLSDRAEAIAAERKISFGEALKLARRESGASA